ncbi:MAG: hypothetical protein K2X66_01135 [Cyanobacteria bacterium]|nr:hypothetical protein [Cyanobacteriota bacterium]
MPSRQENTMVLKEQISGEITIFSVKDSTQYVVVTAYQEYSFTDYEEAYQFAKDLDAKKAIYKTASLDRSIVNSTHTSQTNPLSRPNVDTEKLKNKYFRV